MADPLRYYASQPGYDYVNGTKQQLQALGIGVGLAFPGEPGAPKRSIETTDPRGYRALVRADDDGRFLAYVHFPNIPQEPYSYKRDPSQSPFPGVTCRSTSRFDEYRGRAEALIVAGLVPAGHFPGMPGMRKVRVTLLPDGSLPRGAPTANCRAARDAGARTVECLSKAKAIYGVSVFIDDAEEERRRKAHDSWYRQVLSMPRPLPLTQYVQSHPVAAPVWSAPPTLRRRTSHPAPAAELFAPPPASGPAQQAYVKHVFDSLRDFVDFTQTSAY